MAAIPQMIQANTDNGNKVPTAFCQFGRSVQQIKGLRRFSVDQSLQIAQGLPRSTSVLCFFLLNTRPL